jgi:chemotaxis protein methyltransferase CheR
LPSRKQAGKKFWQLHLQRLRDIGYNRRKATIGERDSLHFSKVLLRPGKRTALVVATPPDNSLLAHAEISNDELAEIGTILSMWRSINMSAYKDKCMKRRVAIRMRSTHCRDAGEYCNLLRQSQQELDLLQKALTIHVSQFFRNPSLFDKLRAEVFPWLFKQCKTNENGMLRIWCLGCAGGEEPYSLAILLKEYFGRELRTVRTAINGTDIDAEIIRTAQQAEYTVERLKDVPAELRNRYFRQSGQRFRLVPEIREMVTFLQGDITSISAHIPSDLVVCRNTLIYFTRPDQGKILHGVADILSEGGILVLGKSETLVGDVRRRFEAVCPVERIYRRL